MNANQNKPLSSTFARQQAAAGWALATVLSLGGMLSPLAAQAGADAASGKQVYDTRCLGCHGDRKAEVTFGPSLIGIFGRKAATAENGVHSRALIESGITWDEASLRRFLAAPTKQLPGTNMPVGIPDPQQIDDLLAYLRTLR